MRAVGWAFFFPEKFSVQICRARNGEPDVVAGCTFIWHAFDKVLQTKAIHQFGGGRIARAYQE